MTLLLIYIDTFHGGERLSRPMIACLAKHTMTTTIRHVQNQLLEATDYLMLARLQ